MTNIIDSIFSTFRKNNDLLRVNKSILLSKFQYGDIKRSLIQQINLNLKWLESNTDKILKLI